VKATKKRRTNLPCKVVLPLFLALLAAPSGATGPDVVYKSARAKKDLTKTLKSATYAYDPTGKVDPFAPFILKGKARQKDWTKTDLQLIPISELILTGIIKSEDTVLAMVTDPKGKGYILKRGTYVGTNGGVVERIVCEDVMKPWGIEPVRKVVVKEPRFDLQGKLGHRLIEIGFPKPMK
jgi:type IV pilus assembly protein PilP